MHRYGYLSLCICVVGGNNTTRESWGSSGRGRASDQSRPSTPRTALPSPSPRNHCQTIHHHQTHPTHTPSILIYTPIHRHHRHLQPTRRCHLHSSHQPSRHLLCLAPPSIAMQPHQRPLSPSRGAGGHPGSNLPPPPGLPGLASPSAAVAHQHHHQHHHGAAAAPVATTPAAAPARASSPLHHGAAYYPPDASPSIASAGHNLHHHPRQHHHHEPVARASSSSFYDPTRTSDSTPDRQAAREVSNFE